MSVVPVRHPAVAARILTAGFSTAAMLGIVAWLARDAQRSEPPPTTVEVRIGEADGDAATERALAAWLEGNPDVTTAEVLTVVDLPPDTVSEPS